MYKLFFKYVFDFVLALLFLIFMSPVLLLLIFLLYFANKNAGIFFLQERPGRNGKIFKIFKFKTMTDELDKDGNFLPDAKRLTGTGRFLRSSSLDEIPQLLNVIKGDMSLVGPRPLAVKYLPYYTEEEMTRHQVKPGITGLAQVSGRNSINWDTKLQIDVEYVKSISFKMDFIILYRTLLKVISRKNVSTTGIDAPGDFDKYRILQNRR